LLGGENSPADLLFDGTFGERPVLTIQ
jgi:hypothetical protein